MAPGMSSKQHFSGKVVWITGASSGIGEALAYVFSGQDAKVVLSSNEENELDRVKKNCRGNADNLMVLPLDLTEFGTFKDKTLEVMKRFGHVDILINNGGISHRSRVIDTHIDVLKRVMDIDFTGHAALTQAVLPSMIERKSGHIVVTSSLAGLMSFPNRAAYCAAKHALQGFFISLRAEVWRDGIKVTLICPAGVRTRIGYTSLLGDGGQYGKTDKHIEAGMSPEYCAGRIIRAIVKGKEEARLGGFMQRFPVYIAQLFPSVYSWLIGHVKTFG
jgi:short-subunit dehydrogenase